MYEPAPALGLTLENSNKQIRDKALEFIKSVGYVILGTTALDGKTSTSRGMEVHTLDDEGNLYIGVSKGKPIYDELKQYPYISGAIVRSTVKRLSASVRFNAKVEETSKSHIIKRYWELNPGTKSLYRKDLENFKIFKLTEGDGEIFHVCEDDKVARVRFFFGKDSHKSFRYIINENCTGCGICADACLTSTIEPKDDKFFINHFGCLECGKCFEVCPDRAIDKR